MKIPKRVCIIGGGRSGISAALLAKWAGCNDVFLSELKKIDSQFLPLLENNAIKYEEGQHSIDIIKKYPLIIKSPGIPRNIELFSSIDPHKIIGECEWAYRFIQGKIIAITGSLGKSTLTTWIKDLLSTAGFDAIATGNYEFGPTLSSAVVMKNSPDTWFITELSSFQLEDIKHLRADIAIITNIYPNHLDRYETLNEYLNAKMNICKNPPKNALIVNAGCSYLKNIKWENAFHSPSPKTKIIELFKDVEEPPLTSVLMEILKTIAQLIKIPKNTLEKFLQEIEKHKIPHRLESITKPNNITFINDSKSTIPWATYHSLLSINSKNIILILGGKKDTYMDYSILAPLIQEKVKAVIITGENANMVSSNLSQNKSPIPVIISDTLEDALSKAYQLAKPHYVILFSPGAKSFDKYKNYQERGLHFKKIVNNI